jgi:hypothetical protein
MKPVSNKYLMMNITTTGLEFSKDTHPRNLPHIGKDMNKIKFYIVSSGNK